MSSKEERIDIGRRLYHRELDFYETQRNYYVSEQTLKNWIREYKQEAGIIDPNYIISDATLAYSNMTKDELINELMKKDIETERLKKGYTVKGVGAKKEFVTIKDANMK